MTKESFNSLSKSKQQEELEKCKSFEYFYNNYCKIDDNMPDFSQKVWEEYLKMAENHRYVISKPRRGETLCMKEYPLTPEECFKSKL